VKNEKSRRGRREKEARKEEFMQEGTIVQGGDANRKNLTGMTRGGDTIQRNFMRFFFEL
jgi:hypothetical protein